MKRSLLLLLIFSLFIVPLPALAETGDIVDLSLAASWLSANYQEMALQLQETYPDLIYLEEIGASRDGKPLYVLVMTSSVQQARTRDDFTTFRMHYYVDAGTHARETANPAIVLRQIEDFALDYYDDTHIPSYNVRGILMKSVIHFIPLVNPDGHDLTKAGPSSVRTPEARALLAAVPDTSYSQWKANIAGVDLNRNYPDRYVDPVSGQWANKWQKYLGIYNSDRPAMAHYPGEPASEPETRAIMDYIHRYDFRNFLTYHSRGRVIYYGYKWHPASYNEKAGEMARLAAGITGYGLIQDTQGKGSGYATEYFTAQTLKPTITVETVPHGTATPTEQKYILPAYQEVGLLPLALTQLGGKSGYYPYRLYVDGQYIRDFYEPSYAYAHARETGGIIVTGTGRPEFRLPLTREEALHKILEERYDLTSLTVDATDVFGDTRAVLPTFARNQGIVSRTERFRPADLATPEEYATMLYNADLILGRVSDESYMDLIPQIPYAAWADRAVRYVLYHNLMNPDAFGSRYISLSHIPDHKASI